MASIWQAPEEIRRTVLELRDAHHPHLSAAGFWVLVSDGKAIRSNRLVVTQSKKCTNTEKLSSGFDFKIIVMAEAWAELPDKARRIYLDEALCRCAVKFVPQTMEVNGKKEVVKDELGRVVFTDEIDYDKNGQPKWAVNPPDAGLFYDMLMRHGEYSEEAENVNRAIANKPIKQPTIAVRADVIDEVAVAAF